MNTIEKFADLMSHKKIKDWHDHVIQIGNNLGYEHTMLAIFPDRSTPIESEFAFLQTNISPALLKKYDDEKMGEVDPVVSHCMVKSTPLAWSADIFSSRKQQELYEEACCYGIRSGVALPIHGPKGEFGVLSFATDVKPGARFEREVMRNLPELSCLRDFIFETSSRFMRRRSTVALNNIELTSREIECLKLCATGKSSWDIAQLYNCTEATVNFHFTNIRRKLGTSSRRMAVIQAMRLGFLKM